MAGEVGCILTKVLIPFVEKEVGSEGVRRILETAGRSREYLLAEHNRIPLPLADRLVHLAMEMMGESDEERWARRFTDYVMDWRPSREERAYGGSYTMALGSPRAIFQRVPSFHNLMSRYSDAELLEFRRNRATIRITPHPGVRIPRWACIWSTVQYERFPTNWGLPRARVVESQCAAAGADACVLHLRWKNPPLGARFWLPTAAGAAFGLLAMLSGSAAAVPWSLGVAALSTALGPSLGAALVLDGRRRHTGRLRDMLAEEVLYSNRQLEKKFGDLESKIEQLSLLIELAGAVTATLDPEKIYDQALERLVYRMGYQGARLYLVDPARRVIRGHKMVGGPGASVRFEDVEFDLDEPSSVTGKVAATGLAVVVNDIETTAEPINLSVARALGIRSLVAVPLRVKDRMFGVLNVVAGEPNRFGAADVDVVSAVANHVALAVDKAESFQTIEDLSRGLEDKVRVRTEQLRAANEELESAYQNLKMTQMQLVQREKMASVGQLVAGVAHELNNPIGFVFSNITTLEDFVRRLRAMLDAYRAAALPDSERARLAQTWDELKLDYALKYLDSMVQGIREGAERTRKIVRDLRVFARTEDDVWQPVDLHEELESSLTLLNHLLRDRVTVHRKFGALPAVECIRSQVDQVFLNLLANAAQAIAGPGEITVETRSEDGAAVVAISDTGPGIRPDLLGRIFDPFFTTKPVGEGTGLGLSISYEIVKKHRGEIRAENRPGGGATFTLRLPMSRGG